MEVHTARSHSAATFVQGQTRPCRRSCWWWQMLSWSPWSPWFVALTSTRSQTIYTSAVLRQPS